MGLLRKAKVAIPPCKYTIEEQLERRDQRTEEKENGKTDGKKRKPAGSKKQSVIKKNPAPTGAPASGPVADGLALSNLNNVTPPASGAVSDSSVATSAPCPAIVTSALRNLNGPSVITGGGGMLYVPLDLRFAYFDAPLHVTLFVPSFSVRDSSTAAHTYHDDKCTDNEQRPIASDAAGNSTGVTANCW